MRRSCILLGVIVLFVFFAPFVVRGATLSIEPTSGTFVVGSTFSVSLFLDTEDESVNAIEAYLSFPPTKLQVVSPSTGFSIINNWIRQPSFNNREGSIVLQGVIPSGIYANKGIISTITFRAKSVGTALIKFLDNSRVILSDGKGTDALRDTSSGVYRLVLPPPAGPIIASETHSDQSAWYSNSTVVLRWAGETVIGGYSYVLNDEPVDIPDNISEGVSNSVAYKQTKNGTSYFHIKALRGGAWGGTSHFSINIDTEPPADFPIEILPSSRTSSRSPIISFNTTDALSGISHYELKVVPLDPSGFENLFFIEAQTRTPIELDIGKYDVIVRAYDGAGNIREVVKGLNIVTPLFKFVGGEGIIINDALTIPWLWVWVIVGFLVLILGYGAWQAYASHYRVALKREKGELPDHVNEKLKELKKYKEKYGKVAVILLVLGIGFMSSIGPIGSVNRAFAQTAELAPPFISTVSRNISNEEIFYIGGKAEAANTPIIIYLQNLQTGETLSQSVDSDKFGEWFYRHPTFLSTGNYLLWVQTKLGDQLSPPSPQVQVTVRQTAVQFGSSRLSYETFYLASAIVLLLVVIGLIMFIVFHAHHGRKKHKAFWREVKEAEESIRRGFAVLRRDIEAELAVVHRAKLNKALSEEAKAKEKQLLRDLDWVQKHIGKEVWDIEKTEHSHS